MGKLLVDARNPRLWHHHAGLFHHFVGTIEFAQVTSNRFIDLTQSPPQLLARKALCLRVDGFELAAVDRDDARVKQVDVATEGDELFANLSDGRTIVPPKVGNRFEIRLETSRQSEEFEVTCALTLQPA